VEIKIVFKIRLFLPLSFNAAALAFFEEKVFTMRLKGDFSGNLLEKMIFSKSNRWKILFPNTVQ
jgi:hypothetical protein